MDLILSAAAIGSLNAYVYEALQILYSKVASPKEQMKLLVHEKQAPAGRNDYCKVWSLPPSSSSNRHLHPSPTHADWFPLHLSSPTFSIVRVGDASPIPSLELDLTAVLRGK